MNYIRHDHGSLLVNVALIKVFEINEVFGMRNDKGMQMNNVLNYRSLHYHHFSHSTNVLMY